MTRNFSPGNFLNTFTSGKKLNAFTIGENAWEKYKFKKFEIQKVNTFKKLIRKFLFKKLITKFYIQKVDVYKKSLRKFFIQKVNLFKKLTYSKKFPLWKRNAGKKVRVKRSIEKIKPVIKDEIIQKAIAKKLGRTRFSTKDLRALAKNLKASQNSLPELKKSACKNAINKWFIDNWDLIEPLLN